MKFLIWLGVLIPVAFLKVFLENAAGGPMPLLVTVIITAPVFFIAPALCRKYDERKKKNDPQELNTNSSKKNDE